MFELIGIFDWNSSHPSNSSELTLPALKWGRVDREAHKVGGSSLSACFAEHPSTVSTYSWKGDSHLFIVGEARLRSDASAFLEGRSSSIMSAADLFSLMSNENENFFQRLKGNFVIVTANGTSGTVVIYNSRFGISPFYYALERKKLLFSTSLLAISENLSSAPDLDPAAVAELALFNYPIGARTYFKGIKMLMPAEKIIVENGDVQTERYWDVRTLYQSELLSTKEALETGAEIFHRTVNDYVSDIKRVRLSFTSGFDSRAILSVLEKDREDYLCYSFGTPESLNVTIPKQMSRKTGFSYQEVVLSEIYEQNFNEYAIRAIMLSDCLSTVERANYPYAFEKLAEFSPIVITGLFGSELLRTFQNVGGIVSANVANLNLSSDPKSEMRSIFGNTASFSYFHRKPFKNWLDEVESDLNITLWEPFSAMTPDKRFYMLLLTEGLRKYFGAEMQMERPYGINRTPFLDDEFVEFLFRAPFAGVYSRTLKPTVGNRYRSQYFYSYIIKKYRPELLNANTDHGYPPGDVLSPFAPLNMAIKQLISRRKRMKTNYREFKTEEWTGQLYKERLSLKNDRDWITPAFVDDFKSGKWLENRLEFAKAASLKMWMDFR